jgi:hypothetical protein
VERKAVWPQVKDGKHQEVKAEEEKARFRENLSFDLVRPPV